MKLSNIELVFVAYSASRIAKNRAKLLSCFEFFLSLGLQRIILVNNTTDLDLSEFQKLNCVGNVEVIRGSNLHAEFSGWIEGISHSADKQSHIPNGSTSYILMNDTVFSHYPLHMKNLLRFSHAIKQQETPQPCVIGTSHKRKSGSCEVMGFSLSRFIATAFFYINAQAVPLFTHQCQAVFELIDNLDINRLNSYELLSKFYNEAGAYYIGNWLFSGGWYGSTSYEQFDKTLLKLKLAAIVCEHSTSASILAHNGELIDFNQASANKGDFTLLRNLTLAQNFKLLDFKKSHRK